MGLFGRKNRETAGQLEALREELRALQGLTVPAELGGPAEIRLISPVFPTLNGDGGAARALAAHHVPSLGSASAE